MQIFGFDKYKLYINERFSYIAENGKVRKQKSMSVKNYDGGNLMLYIANELDKEDCIAVEFGDDFIRFAYQNFDTGETDYITVNIRREVEK